MGGRFAPCQWALCPRHGTNAHFNIMSIYLNILFKIVTGGRFDRQFHPMSVFFPSQFSPKKCDILQVYFWPDFWSLTVCSESHKSAIVACVLVRWHSWTWFVYVVGPIRLVSWPAWRASSGAVSPQTQARRACQLNRKHSRFRGRTCGHNAGFLMCFGQQ